MKRNLFAKFALTTTMMALPMFGGPGLGAKSKSADEKAAQKMAKKVHSWARAAEKDLAQGQYQTAEQNAELAVEADLTNVDYRSLLARIYMAQGRFASAERTLTDVMELGQVDARTVVGVAIMRIAQGKTNSAISLIEANMSIVPASDYGLALALSGDTKKAVEVLTDAIRSDNATARTRQNLALAYALDGRWREARVMAVQDMPETAVNERIAEWALYARPGAYEARVAGLLQVTPVADDPGQPVRLALSNANSNVQMAQAAELPAVAAAPVVELASVESNISMVAPVVEAEPVRIASAQNIRYVSIPVGIPAEFESKTPTAKVSKQAKKAPLISAPSGPTKVAGTSQVAAKKPVKLALADTSSVAAPAAPRKISGSHLVQLGAYASSAGAKAAWEKLAAKHSGLNNFTQASQTVDVNGKRFVRLAASGFGNKDSAVAFCNKIKSSGGDCLVRSTGGEAAAPQVKLAQAKPRIKGTLKSRPVKIASR